MARQTKGTRSAAVDAYIAKANPVFQPMMENLRDAVHQDCPGVDETLKWGMPSFIHRGKILCAMAAFKQHKSFGYWQHAEVIGADVPRDGMGSYGKMRGPADMPKAATLKADIRKAMALIDAAASGAAPSRPKPSRQAKPALAVPEDFQAVLSRKPKALKHFDAFSLSRRREYI